MQIIVKRLVYRRYLVNGSDCFYYYIYYDYKIIIMGVMRIREYRLEI